MSVSDDILLYQTHGSVTEHTRIWRLYRWDHHQTNRVDARGILVSQANI